ncbi:nitrous oxide reductase accessory protein NosL [Thermanaeromonas sp. C210]|uniref:nitrous oxide reductase accessory protein NosL n=1 Tax=Thermanaeromonas sp. C210 TaxID=2731925 RepID=UPI00155B8E8B|nr:nitrous oxide reductase accessory protein NosL [Thermanaeromonas sp. C210]GFN22831.1 lipoprotein involved in nitrous oxide reduction [Thermanaeromonas sp. C210]
MVRCRLFLLLLVGLALAGCGGGPEDVEPQAIDPTLDICPVCKMSIVDMHFAAQLIDSMGNPISFDDIGCMVLYLKRLGPEGSQGVKALYVTDFNMLEWLPAREAYYVQGRINTPMGFGIVACSQEEEAQRLAERTEGKVLTWEEVLEAKLTVGFDPARQAEDKGEQDASEERGEEGIPPAR